jgi:nucleoside-diphosphate-sugar epimerase
MSIERIRRELGFTPCTTAQGLAATAASLRQKGT